MDVNSLAAQSLPWHDESWVAPVEVLCRSAEATLDDVEVRSVNDVEVSSPGWLLFDGALLASASEPDSDT